MNQIDYLRKEIMNTGYPLEIEISCMLDKLWKNVENTDTYVDTDGRTLRDIDIHAWETYQPKKTFPLFLHTEFVIECKKSKDFAWIFFTRPFEPEIDDVAGQYADELQAVIKNTENYKVLNMIFDPSVLHYASFERKAVAFDAFALDAKKSSYKKKKKEIFEAQNQLKKFIGCFINQIINVPIQIVGYHIQIFFPCIVFDGLMYEAIVDDDELKLEEANHLVLKTLRRSPYSVFEKGLLIDVVSKNYFNDYQKIIRKDISTLKKIFRRKATRIVREIDETISLVESVRTKTN